MQLAGSTGRGHKVVGLACAPGRPAPQGDSQLGSPGLPAFQSAKSLALRFSSVSKLASPSLASSLDPTDHGLSLPYVCPAALRARAAIPAGHAPPSWLPSQDNRCKSDV